MPLYISRDPFLSHSLPPLILLSRLTPDRKPEQNEPEQDSFHIAKETDRIYVNTPNDLVIQDGYHGSITLSKNAALPDAVLWNPWVAKAASMGDYNNYGWTNMVCIEAAAIKDPVTVDAGKSWYVSNVAT